MVLPDIADPVTLPLNYLQRVAVRSINARPNPAFNMDPNRQAFGQAGGAG